MNVKTADGENFVLFNNKDDGIVVFDRPHLDFLADADCVLMDGTFKFSPSISPSSTFSQLRRMAGTLPLSVPCYRTKWKLHTTASSEL